MLFPSLFLASPLFTSSPTTTRVHGWRIDEGLKWLEEKKRGKKQLPISLLRTLHFPNKQILLFEAREKTEGTKVKTKLFIFYS